MDRWSSSWWINEVLSGRWEKGRWDGCRERERDEEGRKERRQGCGEEEKRTVVRKEVGSARSIYIELGRMKIGIRIGGILRTEASRVATEEQG